MTTEDPTVDLGDLDYRGAADRIASLVRRTPTLRVGIPGSAGESDVILKLESLQVTGSFKIRGAANFLLRLSPEQRAAGVVACSSGNHGRAVAHVAQALGVPATICVPTWVDPGKLSAMRSAGADVVLAGESYDDAEDRALEFAASDGGHLIHPFDHPRIVEGQGSLGLEIAEDVRGPAFVAVPLSGGGLVAGVGGALKSIWPETRIVAVSALRADTMMRSIQMGHPVDAVEEETIAEALAGGIGRPNRFTFDWVRGIVDHLVSVTEPEIEEAMSFAFHEMGLRLEGGGAVALAAALAGRLVPAGGPPSGGPTVVVLSGSNVAHDRLASVAAGYV